MQVDIQPAEQSWNLREEFVFTREQGNAYNQLPDCLRYDVGLAGFTAK